MTERNKTILRRIFTICALMEMTAAFAWAYLAISEPFGGLTVLSVAMGVFMLLMARDSANKARIRFAPEWEWHVFLERLGGRRYLGVYTDVAAVTEALTPTAKEWSASNFTGDWENIYSKRYRLDIFDEQKCWRGAFEIVREPKGTAQKISE